MVSFNIKERTNIVLGHSKMKRDVGNIGIMTQSLYNLDYN